MVAVVVKDKFKKSIFSDYLDWSCLHSSMSSSNIPLEFFHSAFPEYVSKTRFSFDIWTIRYPQSILEWYLSFSYLTSYVGKDTKFFAYITRYGRVYFHWKTFCKGVFSKIHKAPFFISEYWPAYSRHFTMKCPPGTEISSKHVMCFYFSNSSPKMWLQMRLISNYMRTEIWFASQK